MPKHQSLAHAGWGVAYGNKDCTLNDFGPLESPVQTSYRAEVRAAAQAIARVCPSGIFVDCQAVVTQANDFLRTGNRDATKATGLWDFIYNRLELVIDNEIILKWVPSHLDEKHKHGKRAEYLRDGTITREHSDGNNIADELADAGACMHNIDPYVTITARDRAKLTAAVQDHLVASWCAWITHTRGASFDPEQVLAIKNTCNANDKRENEEDELQ